MHGDEGLMPSYQDACTIPHVYHMYKCVKLRTNAVLVVARVCMGTHINIINSW